MATAIATEKKNVTGAAAKNVGRIVQVIGPVLDIEFEGGHLPAIYNAVRVRLPGTNGAADVDIIAEVEQHLGEGRVRTVAMKPTDGLQRGMEAIDLGAPITVPVGPATLGRVLNVLGEPVDYPDRAVVSEHQWPIHRSAPSLEEQSTALAHGLPRRPLVLGGCCCAHVGAIRGLAARHDRLAVVWLDAHGDLNTPETSPSGNLWGMPLRMAIDEGSVRTEDVALVGARDLDLPEQEYVAEHGIDDDLARALRDTDAAYVALDVDVLEPGSVSCFMPAPGGPEVADVERLLLEIASRRRVAGMGLTGLAPGADPAVLARFAAMAGL